MRGGMPGMPDRGMADGPLRGRDLPVKPQPTAPGKTAGRAALAKTEKGLKIWAHDLKAAVGKTYCYRMRVVMYNPLAGWTLFLKDRDALLQAGLASPWSDISNPVTVQKDLYFFVNRSLDDREGARIIVYKWHKGWLCKESFRVELGQTIGGKKVSTFYKEQGTRLTKERGKVDFSTGAILLTCESPVTVTVRDRLDKRSGEFVIREDPEATVIVARLSTGELVRQDTANVRDDPGWSLCETITINQRKKIKTMGVIRQEARTERAERRVAPRARARRP